MSDALDRLSATDELSHGDYAVNRLDTIGFLVGDYQDLFEVFNSQEIPVTRPFKVIGDGEDQYTEALR